MNGIIDISRLGELKDYSVTETFQPRWDNVLLMTAYDRERTYVLTIGGEELILPKRLHEVVHDFCEFAGVHQLEMQTLYNIVKGRTMGVIAGHYELVPTCGRGNCQVVYYMAHHLDNYQERKASNSVLLTFKGHGGRLISVTVDACIKTFERLLYQAHQVGKIQLETVKNLCNRFGVGDDELVHFSCGTTFHEQTLHRQQCERVLLDQIIKVVKQTADKHYGEDFDDSFYAQLKRILESY